MAKPEHVPMTAGTAVYLAGVAFSFGVRLGQLPLPDLEGDPVRVATFLVMVCLELALSVATSWLGAGLALGR